MASVPRSGVSPYLSGTSGNGYGDMEELGLVPQTVLALRVSYGVAKERGYDLFVDPVAPASEHISLYFAVLRDTYPQKHIVRSTN